jgi:CBS domain-containing protein
MPPLTALCLFNGTVYRWNRACYGVKDNIAHLRIENRVIPSGPTVQDEVANAAFYFGLLAGISAEYDDVSKVLDFDIAKENFFAAARNGLQARFRWIGGRTTNVDHLILDELLPIARAGLKAHNVDTADIDKYIGIIEERVRTGRTGARWMLDSLTQLGSRGLEEERYRAMTGAMLRRQKRGRPVHTWKLARFDELADWRQSFRVVGQVMTKNARTVHPEDVIDLAASLMNWERIRHLPVEDDEGRLVGIVTHRTILRLFTSGRLDVDKPLSVREVMHADPWTVLPTTTTLEAIGMMRDHNIGALPVVDEAGKLVGIVTERDFIEISRRLLEATLREVEEEDSSLRRASAPGARKPSSR